MYNWAGAISKFTMENYTGYLESPGYILIPIYLLNVHVYDLNNIFYCK